MNRILDALPEAFVSHAAISRAVSRAVGSGELRKLGTRLYAKNLDDDPEAVVRRNLWSIVAGYFPGGLVADRTAIEAGPAPDGSVFLVTSRGRAVEVPGAILRPRRGHGPIASDMPFVHGLRLSSRARAFLENMRPSRSRGGRVARTLAREEIEARLDRVIRTSGEDGINQLRDEARAAAELRLESEAAQLDALIGAMLGTRDAPLESKLAVARSRRRPFDPARLELFGILHRELRNAPPRSLRAPARSPSERSTLAFFEAYFSNFVEGTEFTVGEARRIVFEGEIPRHRPADAHDILGTWRIVSDPGEMTRRSRDADSFANLLRERHRTIMAGRPETGPGSFKEAANRAGLTEFVAPDLVSGTLEACHAFLDSDEAEETGVRLRMPQR